MDRTSEKEIVRLFVAVDMPPEVIQQVKHIQCDLQKANLFHGSYTKQENLHVTLQFLGSVNQEKVFDVQQALNSVHAMPFDVSLADLGVNNPEHISVIWMNLIGEGMYQLAKQISGTLSDWFEPDSRGFKSHLTIARVKSVYDRDKLLDHINQVSVEPISFTVDSFVLKQSELTREGSIYTDLQEYQLSL